ncbi:MAG: UDP-glucose/GDP-mannose dehydrogenase family protein [Planctomycetes bacterium]|nr:UDP-glucose/GDP-mannose dehydrogenase family protein [Planctomycetota bacterium]
MSGLTFGLWGLAFKPNTDDMREAPAITIVNELRKRGAQIKGYDPEATETAREILGDSLEYCQDPYSAIEGADALILATEWKEFRRPDFDRMGSLLKRKLIFDGRNIYPAKTMNKYGFERHGVGVPSVQV